MTKAADKKITDHANGFRAGMREHGGKHVPADRVRGVASILAASIPSEQLHDVLRRTPTETEIDLWWSTLLDGWDD